MLHTTSTSTSTSTIELSQASPPAHDLRLTTHQHRLHIRRPYHYFHPTCYSCNVGNAVGGHPDIARLCQLSLSSSSPSTSRPTGHRLGNNTWRSTKKKTTLTSIHRTPFHLPLRHTTSLKALQYPNTSVLTAVDIRVRSRKQIKILRIYRTSAVDTPIVPHALISSC